jgi:hypothetical protein
MTADERLDTLEMALGESGLDIQELLNRAIEKRNRQLQAEQERLRQERLARKQAAEEELLLKQLVYQATVKDALTAAVEREKESRYIPSDVEKAMVSGEIAFDSAKIRSTTWRYFPDFYITEISKARHSIAMAKQKLNKIAQD